MDSDLENGAALTIRYRNPAKAGFLRVGRGFTRRQILMKNILTLALAAFALFSMTTRSQAENTNITISVGSEPQQKFAGFGASLGNWGYTYQKLSPADRATLSRSLWRDLKFKTLRLWFNMDQYAPTAGAHDMSQFMGCYVDSGIIADARKNGVTTLLLAPEHLPPHMKEKRPTENGNTVPALKDSEVDNYATLIAEFVLEFKKKTGITLNATGIQNEPNDANWELITRPQIVRIVKTLRRELDARGLRSVQIIAPESSSADFVLYEDVDALKADPVAWKSLRGVASHSYNMAATPDVVKRITGTDKEYWMTEASDNGPEVPGDALRSASLASRFLNDVNNRVTHWIHFLGFETADPNDNATRILAYTPAPFQVTRYQKFYYYQQLAQTFDVGALFRHSTSDIDGEMTYTYGKKPRINAAVARNPDGSWGIGLSNFTAPSFVDAENPKDFFQHNSGYAAKTFTVTVRIPELAGRKDVRFNVRRSNSNINNVVEQSVILHDGTVTIPNISPLDLITLRSGK